MKKRILWKFYVLGAFGVLPVVVALSKTPLKTFLIVGGIQCVATFVLFLISPREIV